MTRPGPVTGMLIAVLLIVPGCGGGGPGSGPSSSSSSPTATASSGTAKTCDDVTTQLLGTVQRYVDAYGTTLSARKDKGGDEETVDDTDLRNALTVARQELADAECDLKQFREDFTAGMEQITARGPLARAILLRLTASMTGGLGTAPQTVTVRARDRLDKALAGLAPGSTVRLARGAHRLRDPLVLLTGVTLRGAGRGRTTVVSSAGGSAILVLTDERVEVRDLTLRHRGRAPSSLVVGGPTSSLVLTSARLTGALSARKKGGGDPGGSAVTMTARSDATRRQGTTLQVTDSDLSGNGAAGILLSGGHRASIRSTRFGSNGQCGVCFAGASSGAVRASTFVDNGVGVAVLDQARPVLTSNVFTGGEVGVQASGRAAPAITGARITRPRRAAMIFGDTANGRVSGARCTGAAYGIVVGPKSYPLLGRNQCPVAEGQ